MLLVSCGRIDFDPLAPPSDATPRCTWGPFGAVQHSPVSSAQIDWGPSLSADGLTLYFSSNRGGNEDIWFSARSSIDQPFPAAQHITELAMAGDEEGNPSIAPDDLTLYWGQTSVWKAVRAAPTDTWGPRQLVIAASTGVVSPQGPAISSDELTLYFSADAASSEIFEATRADRTAMFGAPQLVAVNSTTVDGWPAISADELELYFVSDREGGGDLDLYVATRPDRVSAWGTPIPLSTVNSVGSEDVDPALSFDGTTLWFSSNRPGTTGGHDLYFTTRACAL